MDHQANAETLKRTVESHAFIAISPCTGCRSDACVVGYGAMSGAAFPGPFMADPERPDLFGADPADRHYLAPEQNIRPGRFPHIHRWGKLCCKWLELHGLGVL